jgi:hypothetical protein
MIAGTKLEEEIVKIISTIGPVVTLGSTFEERQTIGAYRVPVESENWQDIARTFTEKSNKIIIMLNSSQSLIWEINNLATIKNEEKFIFLIPPFKLHDSLKWDECWNEIISHNNILPKISYKRIINENIIGLYKDQEGSWVFVKSRNNKTKEYLSCLGDFIERMQNDYDKKLCKVFKSSKRSWVFPCVLFANVLASSGGYYGEIEQLMMAIFNVSMILIGLYHYSVAIFAEKSMKRIASDGIAAGTVAHSFIVFLFLLFPLFMYYAHR